MVILFEVIVIDLATVLRKGCGYKSNWNSHVIFLYVQKKHDNDIDKVNAKRWREEDNQR